MTSRSVNSNVPLAMIAKSKSTECVSPATSPPPSKTYQTSPIESPNDASKDEKELRVLTNTVQALAKKLKKRDRELQQLQEKADKFNEVTLELEAAEERLVDTVAENQTLTRRVKNLEATINMQGVEEGHRWNTVAKAPIVPAQHIDEAVFRKLRLQRDSAMSKAGEMSMALAESRAESDELRDQMAAVSVLMQQQKLGSSLVSESPVSVTSPLKRGLSNLFMSTKLPARPPLVCSIDE